MSNHSDKVKYFDVNHQGRDFVVGDLHGCHQQLMLLLDHINFDRTVDRLFSVGDLIDRGADSVKCLQLLDQPWFFAVRGNHEQMMYEAVTTANGYVWDLWQVNGGKWGYQLAEQYSIATLQSLVDRYIAQLPYVIVIQNDNTRFNIVHAELYSDSRRIIDDDIDNWTFSDSELDCLIWGRSVIMDISWFDEDQLSITFCGHTPVRTLKKRGNQYFIDTGCVYGLRRKGVGTQDGLTIVEPMTMKAWTLCCSDNSVTQHHLPVDQ